jgi:glutaminase
MPAKSGVSGGVVAVLPGQLGIGVFSPRLDERGNSVRGVNVCADLSRYYSLHMLSVPNLGSSAVRAGYDATSVRSKRRRQWEESEALTSFGSRIQVYKLQGDLVFASAEAFSRLVMGGFDGFDLIAMDFKHASRIADGALTIMLDLIRILREGGKHVALSQLSRMPELGAHAAELALEDDCLQVFSDEDLALEWCENRLLERVAPQIEESSVVLADNELCRGLDGEAVRRLESAAKPMRFDAGATIIRAGESGDSVFLLVRGEVSVAVDLEGGGTARVATLSAGMTFGEMALLGESLRSAHVSADSEVECWELTIDGLATLSESDPLLRATVYENLGRKLVGNLRRANAEVQALSG